MTQPIYPCLWFDGQAKAAAEFYCSVFENSKIIHESPMVVNWEIDGRRFMGLNGGPQLNQPKVFHLYWNAKTRLKLIITGTRLQPMAARKACVAGAKINLAFGGR